MLRIGQDVYDAIVAHARKDHPDEACGIVAGPEGSDTPTGSADDERRDVATFFQFDPTEQLKVWRELDDRDEVPL